VHSSVDADEVDLSGLVESIVDSDEEEDLAESMDVSFNLVLISLAFPSILFISWKSCVCTFRV